MLIFFLSLLNLKFKMPPTHFSHRASRSPFLSCPPAERIRKRPYFPLPLSILTGTNLIMLLLLLLFFCNPRLIPKKIHPPFDFRENSSSFDFRENPSKNPATPVWFPRKPIPHSISGKTHPRLIFEKIQAKTQGKPKKWIFFCSLHFLDPF